jgi:predicted HTH domain antitoxin
MASITVEVPDELIARLKNSWTDVGEALRVEAAFSLCSRGELSTSQAARLAGMAYADFLQAAARAKVMLFPVNLEELQEEATRGYTLGRERLASDPASRGGTP